MPSARLLRRALALLLPALLLAAPAASAQARVPYAIDDGDDGRCTLYETKDGDRVQDDDEPTVTWFRCLKPTPRADPSCPLYDDWDNDQAFDEGEQACECAPGSACAWGVGGAYVLRNATQYTVDRLLVPTPVGGWDVLYTRVDDADHGCVYEDRDHDQARTWESCTRMEGACAYRDRDGDGRMSDEELQERRRVDGFGPVEYGRLCHRVEDDPAPQCRVYGYWSWYGEEPMTRAYHACYRVEQPGGDCYVYHDADGDGQYTPGERLPTGVLHRDVLLPCNAMREWVDDVAAEAQRPLRERERIATDPRSPTCVYYDTDGDGARDPGESCTMTRPACAWHDDDADGEPDDAELRRQLYPLGGVAVCVSTREDDDPQCRAYRHELVPPSPYEARRTHDACVRAQGEGASCALHHDRDGDGAATPGETVVPLGEACEPTVPLLREAKARVRGLLP